MSTRLIIVLAFIVFGSLTCVRALPAAAYVVDATESVAPADAGTGAAQPAPEQTASTSADKAPDDLARDIYRGVTKKDWFLVAGGILSLVVLGVRMLLAKKWPKMESEIWGVALVAVLAGCGGLANAWLADERLASTTTLLGAVKVWAAAVFAYVTTKKLLGAKAA